MSELDYLAERVSEVRECIGWMDDELVAIPGAVVECALLAVQEYVKELEDPDMDRRLWQARAEQAEAERDKFASVLRKTNAEWEKDMVRAREAEAEVDRLKCCGNCKHTGWHVSDDPCITMRCGEDYHQIELPDHCIFTPSRWIIKPPNS